MEQNEKADDDERRRLEGEVFTAVNNLISHMGSSGFRLPGRINPQFAVYVGEPKIVIALANGAMQGAGR